MKTSKTGKGKATATASRGKAQGSSGTGRTVNPITASSANRGESEIDRLATMPVSELQALYADVIGQPTRCPRRGWLAQRIMEAAVPTNPAEGESCVAADEEVPCVIEDVDRGTQNEPAGNPVPAECPISTPEPDAAADPAALTAGSGAGSGTGQELERLTVPELQARYFDVFHRATESSDRRYLLNRLQAALKIDHPMGPRPRHQKTGEDLMVLPLRMEADLVDQLDAAWRRQGLRSRMDLFRRSLAAYLAGVGETDVASLLASDA